MCTAATYVSRDHYFGRNLDLEYSYHEQVTVVPRNFCFELRNGERIEKHEAMIGMAFVAGGYPLFYDAINESGLGMAGLNFLITATSENLPQIKRISLHSSSFHIFFQTARR